jgi:hypothetical protein
MVRGGTPPDVMAVCAVSWIAVGAFWLFRTAWNVWGYWDLVLGDDSLSITASVLGIRKKWTYEVTHITSMSVRELRGRHGYVLRHIVFEYRGRTRRATPHLSSEEAGALLFGPLSEVACFRQGSRDGSGTA